MDRIFANFESVFANESPFLWMLRELLRDACAKASQQLRPGNGSMLDHFTQQLHRLAGAFSENVGGYSGARVAETTINCALKSARERDWLTVEAPKYALMQWWNEAVVPALKQALLQLPANTFKDAMAAARDTAHRLTVDDAEEESAAVREKRRAMLEAVAAAEGIVGQNKGW